MSASAKRFVLNQLQPTGLVPNGGRPADPTIQDTAQEAKLDLVCRKIGLEPGMRILDIGLGWGGFLQIAAGRYGVSGLGVTVSREQAALVKHGCCTIRRWMAGMISGSIACGAII